MVQGPCFVSEELITSGETRSLASLKPQFEFKSLKFTLSVLENNDLYNTQVKEFQRQLQKFKVFHNVSLPFSMWFSRLWQRSKIFWSLCYLPSGLNKINSLTVFPFAQVTVFLNLLLVILGCLSGNTVSLNYFGGLFLVHLSIILKTKNDWSISQKIALKCI